MKMNWYDLSKYRNQLYGLSMLWIVIFHVWEAFKGLMNEKWAIIYIIKSGNYGVDLFLFLSGISMYFAIQRYDSDTGIQLFDFYKKRLERIVKVYGLFCILYFLIYHLIIQKDFKTFFQQVFFLRNHVSSFWFILCITICYLIYPLFYKWIKENKKQFVYMFLGIYIAGLFLLFHYVGDFYHQYEVLLSRIPVFIIGAMFGKKVYEKEEMHPYTVMIAILLLLSKRPLFKLFGYVPLWETYSIIFKRFYGSLIGVCTIILFIMILKYLEDTKIFQGIGELGTFTLETYVFHIAYRAFLISIIARYIKSGVTVILFLFFYTITSFIGGFFLAKLLKKK